MSKIPDFPQFSTPKMMNNEVKKLVKVYAKINTEKDRKNMKNEEVKNMDFGAEHHTVVQIQGSRGSGAELPLHRKMMKNRCKIHPKIDGKSMRNRCSKK